MCIEIIDGENDVFVLHNILVEANATTFTPLPQKSKNREVMELQKLFVDGEQKCKSETEDLLVAYFMVNPPYLFKKRDIKK